jgi:TRAP-type mannitol/chloroaromatic compound transport system substrate-binding protein
MGFTCSYYYFGKDPTYCIDTAIPFGMNSRQTTAWYRHGNGAKLMGEFFEKSNIIAFPSGNTGAQMGGWYRKEMKSVADFKGLKMRVAGLAGAVLAKLGVVPQQIAGSDIYPALEKGTIDAVEWVGPYDDQKLGFNKVAKYYYYPAWWEGGPQISTYINAKKWAELPKEYQAIIESACADTNTEMCARYDAANPAALKQLLASGTKLLPFPKDVMEASYKAAMEYYAETSAKNPEFKKVYDDYKKFLDEQNSWFRVAENEFAKFMYSRR